MRRCASVVLVATLVVSMLQGGIPAAHAGGGETFYLALGTSLTVGYQPGQGRTTDGYVDDLFETSAAADPGAHSPERRLPG